eukprot:1811660-Rhodomonas_salina.1
MWGDRLPGMGAGVGRKVLSSAASDSGMERLSVEDEGLELSLLKIRALPSVVETSRRKRRVLNFPNPALPPLPSTNHICSQAAALVLGSAIGNSSAFLRGLSVLAPFCLDLHKRHVTFVVPGQTSHSQRVTGRSAGP